jgi:protein gp37
MAKRSFLMREFRKECHGGGRGPNHIWFGVSVEDSSKISRIRHLQESPVGVRFLSIEPLIGRMGRLNLTGISDCRRRKRTAASPGESRLGAREIRDQCLDHDVALFF